MKGPDFQGRDQLSSDDWRNLSVTTAVDAPRRLYSDWPGKLIGYCVANLANDNASILNMHFALAGSLWERPHTVTATRFFEDLEAGTSLVFPTLNTNALAFNNGSLVSDYLSHEQLPHEWKRNGQPYPPPGPNKPFSVRAFITPIEGKWAKLWILIFPLAKADLLSTHPLQQIIPRYGALRRHFPARFRLPGNHPESQLGRTNSSSGGARRRLGSEADNPVHGQLEESTRSDLEDCDQARNQERSRQPFSEMGGTLGQRGSSSQDHSPSGHLARLRRRHRYQR